MDKLLLFVKIIWLLNAAVIGFVGLCMLVLLIFTWLTRIIVIEIDDGEDDGE